MRRLSFSVAALLGALVLVAPPAGAYTATKPTKGALYFNGPSGRYLMGGTWLFRLDTAGIGTRAHYMRDRGTAGWKPVTVPNAWNATDDSNASMQGTTAWYRRDFKLPSASRSLDWVVRFESVNYRVRAWLNGHRIGSHTGAYLPFELRLPHLHRRGVNRLVIRVNNHRLRSDFPPSSFSPTGVPTGGWWNYGGVLREVYLRKIKSVDFNTVQIRPDLACARCPASVSYRVTMRNYSSKSQSVHLTGHFGKRSVNLGTRTIAPAKFASFARHLRVPHPRLWSPASPNLYRSGLTATANGRAAGRWSQLSGVRSIKVSGGHLVLNGHQLNVRGVGIHEDARTLGFAIDNKIRAGYIAAVKDLGATMIRAHYPLHPQLEELADRNGILLWSEIPVYGIKTQFLRRADVRRLAAEQLRDNIVANQNHPSIALWSIANELSTRPGPIQADYIRRAVQTAHSIDPSRPVGLAVASYPSAGCQKEYGPLDVIGINEYFGWYPGPSGVLADRAKLGPYLDTVHACYPNKALMITEFGAEANRDGPPEEKGTFGFQDEFVKYSLGVFATKPWLSGALYWTLQEFKIRPGWDGGNPRPQSPLHQKGLISYGGAKKPAWFDVQRIFRGTVQIR